MSLYFYLINLNYFPLIILPIMNYLIHYFTIIVFIKIPAMMLHFEYL